MRLYSDWRPCLWCQFSRELIGLPKVSWTVSQASFMNKSDAFMKNDFQTLHSENQLVNWCLSIQPRWHRLDLDQWLPVTMATNTGALTWECCGSYVLTAPSANVQNINRKSWLYFLLFSFSLLLNQYSIMKASIFLGVVSFVFYLIQWFFQFQDIAYTAQLSKLTTLKTFYSDCLCFIYNIRLKC